MTEARSQRPEVGKLRRSDIFVVPQAAQIASPIATVLVGKLKVFIFEETIHEDDQLAHTGRHGDQWFFTCRQ